MLDCFGWLFLSSYMWHVNESKDDVPKCVQSNIQQTNEMTNFGR